MKNYEKYAEQIKNYDGDNFCKDFTLPLILKREDCNGIGCGYCNTVRHIWLMEEYEEPEADWSKVEVDTPILVRDNEQQSWQRRYFARFKDGKVYAWRNGATLWSTYDSNDMRGWKYAKLAESEDE